MTSVFLWGLPFLFFLYFMSGTMYTLHDNNLYSPTEEIANTYNFTYCSCYNNCDENYCYFFICKGQTEDKQYYEFSSGYPDSKSDRDFICEPELDDATCYYLYSLDPGSKPNSDFIRRVEQYTHQFFNSYGYVYVSKAVKDSRVFYYVETYNSTLLEIIDI